MPSLGGRGLEVTRWPVVRVVLGWRSAGRWRDAHSSMFSATGVSTGDGDVAVIAGRAVNGCFRNSIALFGLEFDDHGVL